MSVFTNEEWARLIKEARRKQREKEVLERKRLERLEHTTLTESEEKQILEKAQREVDEEIVAMEDEERLRNEPQKVQVTYKVIVENKTEPKEKTQEPELERPVFEWIRERKKKEMEGDKND